MLKYSQGLEIKKLENGTTVLDLEGTEIDMEYIWMIWEEVYKVHEFDTEYIASFFYKKQKSQLFYLKNDFKLEEINGLTQFIAEHDLRPENMPDFIPKQAKVYFYNYKRKKKYFPEYKTSSKKKQSKYEKEMQVY